MMAKEKENRGVNTFQGKKREEKEKKKERRTRKMKEEGKKVGKNNEIQEKGVQKPY